MAKVCVASFKEITTDLTLQRGTVDRWLTENDPEGVASEIAFPREACPPTPAVADHRLQAKPVTTNRSGKATTQNFGSGLPASRETVPASLAFVHLAQGDPALAASLGADFGRDADAIACIAAGTGEAISMTDRIKIMRSKCQKAFGERHQGSATVSFRFQRGELKAL